jgi:acyl carrier protein
VPNQPRIGLSQLQELLRDYLHPSKWPFALVYMADLPKNSAGKPLRIKLGQRLGLGCVSDDYPSTKRHLEADVPHPMAALTDPIRCNLVSIELNDVVDALRRTTGSQDVAVRRRLDGSLEAFVSAHMSASDTKQALIQCLPGYAIPEPLHIVSSPLARKTDGSVNYAKVESAIAAQNASSMNSQELLIRDIIADVLLIDPSVISNESDFFLLGGNSLLLGKLSYAIRKQTNVNVAVASIFTNSTVKGIASLLDDYDVTPMTATPLTVDPLRGGEKTPLPPPTPRTPGTMSSSSSYTLYERVKGRNQNHPLVLIVQAIPFIFFYPLKAALTCK